MSDVIKKLNKELKSLMTKHFDLEKSIEKSQNDSTCVSKLLLIHIFRKWLIELILRL